jgi:hypothetical protein
MGENDIGGSWWELGWELGETRYFPYLLLPSYQLPPSIYRKRRE